MYTVYVYIYRIHNWRSSTVFQRLVSLALDLFQEEAAEVAEGSKATGSGLVGSMGWGRPWPEGISDDFHKKLL